MNELKPIHTGADAWAALRAFTPARIALGRIGAALPLKEVLDFRMAHVHARDAVYSLLETDTLVAQLQSLGLAVNLLHSKAANRQEYLQRPDMGRTLHADSVKVLGSERLDASESIAIVPDSLAIVLTDGLSATAINRHAVPLVELLLPMLQDTGISLCPVSIVQQGRVAIGDEVGQLQRAAMSVVLIGERPGLSSPDSMGIYLTYHPKVGLTDEARNCISNVRPEGLSYQGAADKLFWLIKEAMRLQLSGIGLKDNEKLLSSSL